MGAPESTRKCRLCDSIGLRSLFVAKGHRVLGCSHCGFAQVADKPGDDALLALYGEGYFRNSKYRDTRTLMKEERRRTALVEKFLPSRGGRVLDAGCAVGDFVACCSGNFEMSGLDLSPWAVAMARKKNPEVADRIWAGDLEQEDLPRDYYDAICLWDVIEHIWDLRPVCGRLLKGLKPGGYLFLSTPAIDSPVARLMGSHWVLMTPPEHLSFLTRRSLRYLFENALGAEVAFTSTEGKWVNCGFALYKAHRIWPRMVPRAVLRLADRSPFAGAGVYLPTGDIRYAVIRKPGRLE